MNIALNDYTSLVDLMKTLLTHMRQNVQVHRTAPAYAFDIYWEELDRLTKMVAELEDDSEFSKMII